MAKSEALKIARLQCSTQLASQVLGIVTDPLWSTILGFAAVHELRKKDLVGPVADDLLYAGIIAVNTARSPGLQDLAGKGIDAVGLGVAGVAGVAAGKLLAGGAAAGGAAAGAASRLLLPSGATAVVTTGTKASWISKLFTAGSAQGLGAGATALLFGGGRKLPPQDTEKNRAKAPGYFEYHDEYGKWPNNSQLKKYRKARGY